MSAMIEVAYLTTRPDLMRWYEAISSSTGRCLVPVWALKAADHYRPRVGFPFSESVLARINTAIDADPEILNAIKAAVMADAWDIVELLIAPAC